MGCAGPPPPPTTTTELIPTPTAAPTLLPHPSTADLADAASGLADQVAASADLFMAARVTLRRRIWRSLRRRGPLPSSSAGGSLQLLPHLGSAAPTMDPTPPPRIRRPHPGSGAPSMDPASPPSIRRPHPRSAAPSMNLASPAQIRRPDHGPGAPSAPTPPPSFDPGSVAARRQIPAAVARGRAWRARGWARWACPRDFLLFYFLYLINGGGRPTASFNAQLTVAVSKKAFCPPPLNLL